MNCTSCGAQLAPGSAFCGQCRQQVLPQPPPQAFAQQPPGYPPQGFAPPPPPAYPPHGYPPPQGFAPPPQQQQGYQPPMGYGSFQPLPEKEEWRWKWNPLIGITYGPVPIGLIIGGIILYAIYSSH